MAKKSSATKRTAHNAGAAAPSPATRALSAAGVDYTLDPYEHVAGSTDFGDEVARALGVDRSRIFKTLLADASGTLVVAVVPVAGKLDLKSLAAHVGAKKAAMATPEVAERATGMVVGAISPLGQKSTHVMVIDESARGFDTVFVSAGRRGLQVEVAPDDLARIGGAEFAAIGR